MKRNIFRQYGTGSPEYIISSETCTMTVCCGRGLFLWLWWETLGGYLSPCSDGIRIETSIRHMPLAKAGFVGKIHEFLPRRKGVAG